MTSESLFTFWAVVGVFLEMLEHLQHQVVRSVGGRLRRCGERERRVVSVTTRPNVSTSQVLNERVKARVLGDDMEIGVLGSACAALPT